MVSGDTDLSFVIYTKLTFHDHQDEVFQLVEGKTGSMKKTILIKISAIGYTVSPVGFLTKLISKIIIKCRGSNSWSKGTDHFSNALLKKKMN